MQVDCPICLFDFLVRKHISDDQESVEVEEELVLWRHRPQESFGRLWGGHSGAADGSFPKGSRGSQVLQKVSRDAQVHGMGLLLLVWLGVALTVVPILLDILQTLFPRVRRIKRLVAPLAQRMLVAIVLALCALAYWEVWNAVLPFVARRGSPRLRHVLIISILWAQTVWAYIGAISVVSTRRPGDIAPDGDFQSHYCSTCGATIDSFDHHCPFTGNCIGRNNFRFYAQLIFFGCLGMGYACHLSWQPFRECVLTQLYQDPLPPPDVEACFMISAHSLVFIPALVLFGGLWTLFVLHFLLLLNGLTVLQLSKCCEQNGWRALLDLVLLRLCPAHTSRGNKWALIWGRSSDWTQCLKSFLLPGAPLKMALHNSK